MNMSAEKTREFATVALQKIVELIESGVLEKELVLKNGKFRKTVKKDSHHLTAYVHRMITFYSGIDSHIPSTTQFFLQNYVDELFGQDRNLLRDLKEKRESFTVYILSNGVEDLYNVLDQYAEILCVKFGLNPNACVSRWKRCF